MSETLSEEISLPAPSTPSIPLSPGPATPARDTTIQRNAVFGERYLTDPTKVYDHNSWDQVTPSAEHLASALERIKFQQETRLSDKERNRFLERPAYFWDLFYRNNRENFFKNRKWLVREFGVLEECLREDVSSLRPPLRLRWTLFPPFCASK